MTKLKRIGVALGGLLALASAAFVVLARLSSRDPGPGPNGLKFPIDEKLYPFAHHFADLPNGARVHYLDEGAGETIVFLHGNPTWSFLYRNIVKDLRGSYRCIALDYPGFGLSEAPAGYDFLPRTHSQSLEQFFDALKLSNVTLMVQDWAREIIGSSEYLAEVDANLARIADRPALIVWGAKDGGFRPADRERFERRFANHRTVVLETARHFIQEDEPQRIATEIRAFLGSK
jgi:pimeloyl-ACP methyl ester carboxylesterase